MASTNTQKSAKSVDVLPKRAKNADKQQSPAPVLIGITASKQNNFSQWYQEVVTKCEFVEYYEVPGFFILRPPAMHVWNQIRSWFQESIERMGVKEASFPMFLSSKSLEKEKEHVDGFAPELAWVTKAGDKDLETPVAVRPTSEAVMYPYYAKWIRSHRDLPLRLNQWNSVVRWEAKQTTPFLRAREFLWQEGHTAHLTEEGAAQEVLQILELYKGVYHNLLAVPVVCGRKTENEKFAGGYWTSTCEGFIPTTGRGIQGATSHALGQNFSKMFDIMVEDPDPANQGQKIHVWQNSWGLSTRVIGVMIMIHGDDKGLVLPPRVAETQVVLIPVGMNAKMSAEDKGKHLEKLGELATCLREANIRIQVDDREGQTAGFKFAHWEMRGVPLRLEFGPKDAASSVVSYARRDTGAKGSIAIGELSATVNDLLNTIQQDMFTKADTSFRQHRLILSDWAKVVPALNARNVVVIPFCEEPTCEERIKELTKNDEEELGPDGLPMPRMGMKSLCIPFDQPDGIVRDETKCLSPECERFAKSWVMFGRSY